MNKLLENYKRFFKEDLTESKEEILPEKSVRKTKKEDEKGEILQKALELPTDQFAKRFKRVAGDSKVQAILNAGKTDGKPGDEKVSYSETSLPLKDLYPTQNIIGFEESLKHLLDDKYNSLNTILDGKPSLGGPIITANGKWIIDGHHRWSQSYIGNPNGEIKAIDLKINLKPNQIKNIVHMAIAASVGSLPLNDAKGENLLKASKDAIKKYAIKVLEAHPDVVKIWMKYPKLIGTNDSDPKSVIPVIAEYIAKNAEEMQKSNAPAYSGAPGRDSMPQTDKDGQKGKAWLNKISSGELNFISPKAADVKQTKESKMNRTTKLKSLIERMVRREVRQQAISKIKSLTEETFMAFGGIHSDEQLDAMARDIKKYKSKDPNFWRGYIDQLKDKGYDDSSHTEHPHFKWAVKKLNELI